MIPVKIAPGWEQPLQCFFESKTWIRLQNFIEKEEEMYQVYPCREQRFRALELTDYNQVRVVIIGQDPYHGPNQANGLSFSVAEGQAFPPSLRNIFQELRSDIGIERTSPDLADWAQQGVLLLNTVLSVQAKKANSHQNQGWEELTDLIVEVLNRAQQPIVFILWGKQAQACKAKLTNSQHLIIESSHPSPLSAYRGFFGSKPFSQTNDYLLKHGERPIKW